MTLATINPIDAVRRVLMWTLIVSIVAAVIASIVAIMMDVDEFKPSGQIMCTSVLVPGGVGAILAAVAVIARGRWRLLMLASILMTLAGALGLLVLIWYEDIMSQDFSQRFGPYSGMLLTAGVGLAHTGVFSIIIQTRTRLLMLSKITLMTLVWVLGFTILAALWLATQPVTSWMNPLFLLMSFAVFLGAGSLLGTVVVPIAAFSQANRAQQTDEALAARTRLTLACPHCGHRQSLPAGAARCAKCRAGIFIELEEPRCECGYLLYRLVGDSCPECGRAIPINTSQVNQTIRHDTSNGGAG